MTQAILIAVATLFGVGVGLWCGVQCVRGIRLRRARAGDGASGVAALWQRASRPRRAAALGGPGDTVSAGLSGEGPYLQLTFDGQHRIIDEIQADLKHVTVRAIL